MDPPQYSGSDGAPGIDARSPTSTHDAAAPDARTDAADVDDGDASTDDASTDASNDTDAGME
ncbi:hypothetical protein [Labilithrix luteola]|uniref:hypothetical protein n=1 Tax=Labilithrix luteola TaxID=1391654 RepID=UPI0011BADA7B|nr:hypothetical protein [Labilithrix luteola]